MTDKPVPATVRRPARRLVDGEPASPPTPEGDASVAVERTSPVGDVERWSPPPADWEPRDGDSLVVSYPEVLLPLPKQYSSLRVGGFIYTRKLAAGDDVATTAERIYRWLAKFAEETGAETYKRWVDEFRKR